MFWVQVKLHMQKEIFRPITTGIQECEKMKVNPVDKHVPLVRSRLADTGEVENPGKGRSCFVLLQQLGNVFPEIS